MSTTRKPSRKSLRMLLMLPVPLAAIGGIALGALARIPDDQVAPGVHVLDLSLGGDTTVQARTALQQWAENREAVLFTFHSSTAAANRSIYKARARTLDLGIDVEATLGDVLHTGRLNLTGQIGRLVTHDVPNISVVPHLTVDTGAMNKALLHIAHLADIPAQNARVLILKGGGLGLKHDVPGRAISIPAAGQAIQQAWQQFNSLPSTPPSASSSTAQPPEGSQPSSHSAAGGTAPQPAAVYPPIPIALHTVASQAKITYNMVKTIDGKLASFHTWYAEGRRGENIELATEKINGTLLMPGQGFSFNQTVGPRVLSAGFKMAPVIIDGQLTPGVGGGICQVSGTLYNSVLRAGLTVTLRNHHTFPVSDGGLPRGRDATVAYGELDFRFENNLPDPIFIVGRAGGGSLTFALYGHIIPGRTVELERGRTEEKDQDVVHVPSKNVAPGHRSVEQDGRPDIRTVWYRIIKDNGQVISRDTITSHYGGEPTIVDVGPPAAPAAKHTAPKAPSALAPPAGVKH